MSPKARLILYFKLARHAVTRLHKIAKSDTGALYCKNCGYNPGPDWLPDLTPAWWKK